MEDALLYFWGILAGLYTHPQGPGQIPGQNFTHHPIPHVSKSTIKPPVISIELLSASLPTRWDRQRQVLWNSLKQKMLHECMHLLWLFYLLRWSQQLPAIFWTFFVGKYFGKGRKLAEEVSSNHFCKGDQSHVPWHGWGRGWSKSNHTAFPHSRAQSSTWGMLLFILWALQHVHLLCINQISHQQQVQLQGIWDLQIKHCKGVRWKQSPYWAVWAEISCKWSQSKSRVFSAHPS